MIILVIAVMFDPHNRLKPHVTDLQEAMAVVQNSNYAK
jgi:hypothetical protein